MTLQSMKAVTDPPLHPHFSGSSKVQNPYSCSYSSISAELMSPFCAVITSPNLRCALHHYLPLTLALYCTAT